MRKKTQRIVMAVLAGIMALLMLLPIALIFSDNSMANLQTVSIIAAFPIGIIILLIIIWCCCGSGGWGGCNNGCGCNSGCGC